MSAADGIESQPGFGSRKTTGDYGNDGHPHSTENPTMKTGSNLPRDTSPLLNLDPREAVTNAEAIPVPWFAGTRILALQWLMEPVRQFTRPAPDQRVKK